MRHLYLTCGLILATALTPSAVAQSSKSVVVTRTVPITVSKPPLPADAATVDQFREYLKLTGIGEAWQQRWIAAVDLNRAKGRPYWPDSFWDEIKEAMRSTDLAPVARNIWGRVITTKELDDVNAAIQHDGVAAFAQSPLGQKFGSDWDSQQEEQQKATLQLTQALITGVYEKDKPQLDAARAKYMAEHPDYKE